jgi:hypothetical protein
MGEIYYKKSNKFPLELLYNKFGILFIPDVEETDFIINHEIKY